MIVRREITIMLLLISVLLIASCAEKKTPPVQAYTPPVQATAPPVQTSAEKTTASIATVEDDIRALTSRISTVNASLNEVIVSKGDPAAKNAFDAYSKSVSDMDRAAAAFIKDSDQMTARGTDYFREWATSGDTYSDPRIQQLSEARRAELMNMLSQIAGTSTGVKTRVSSYLSQIKEIEGYLSRDMSAAGIDALIPVAQKTITDGQQIIVDAQPMLAAASQARAQIGEIGAATGGVSSPRK